MFRPFEELPDPKHILQPSYALDEVEDFDIMCKPTPLPQVAIDFVTPPDGKHLVVVPEVLDPFSHSLTKCKEINPKIVATVRVTFQREERQRNMRAFYEYEEEELDEENKEVENSTTQSFHIYSIDKSNKDQLFIVTVPKFDNKIIYNILAKEIGAHSWARILTLATADLHVTELAQLSTSVKGVATLSKISKSIATDIGFCSIGAAMYNFTNSEIVVVNAVGAFIDDGERISANCWNDLTQKVAHDYLDVAHEGIVAQQKFLKWRMNSLYL